MVPLVACTWLTGLCASHFLSHVQNQLAISFLSLGQETPELVESASLPTYPKGCRQPTSASADSVGEAVPRRRSKAGTSELLEPTITSKTRRAQPRLALMFSDSMGRGSVNDGPAAFPKYDSVDRRPKYAVEEFIALLNHYGDATPCRKQNVDASEGLGVRLVKANAIFLLIPIDEVDSASPRRNLNFPAGARPLLTDFYNRRSG